MNDPLAGIDPPRGDAGQVDGLARAHATAAEQLGQAGRTVVHAIQVVIGSSWSGVAAQQCAAYATRLAALYGLTADTAELTATALRTYAVALRAAQTQYQQARTLADRALAEEATHRAEARRRAETATLAGDLIGALAIEAGAAGYVSPLRARAVSTAHQAVEDARAAGRRAAAEVEAAAGPITPPPPPKQEKHEEHRGFWGSAWHHVSGFGEGLYHGVADPVVMIGGLVNPFGDPGKHWSELGSGLWHGVTHPVDFGKALIDWKDLSNGEYGRWAGQLLPAAAAAFYSGGASAGARGAEGATALDRAAIAADGLEGAAAADRAAAVGAGLEDLAAADRAAGAGDLFVKHWTPIDEAGPLVPGEGVTTNWEKLNSFRSGTYDERVTSGFRDFYRVYNGDPGARLGAFWTHEPPAGPTQAILDNAIVPQWGNDATAIVHIRVPPGVRYFDGIAGPQGAKVIEGWDHLAADLVGGGHQVVIPNVDPAWLVK
jgi:hypothetical protein